MGKLSNLLMKKQPDFDPRNYGFSKLSKLIKSMAALTGRPRGQTTRNTLSGTPSAPINDIKCSKRRRG